MTGGRSAGQGVGGCARARHRHDERAYAGEHGERAGCHQGGQHRVRGAQPAGVGAIGGQDDAGRRRPGSRDGCAPRRRPWGGSGRKSRRSVPRRRCGGRSAAPRRSSARWRAAEVEGARDRGCPRSRSSRGPAIMRASQRRPSSAQAVGGVGIVEAVAEADDACARRCGRGRRPGAPASRASRRAAAARRRAGRGARTCRDAGRRRRAGFGGPVRARRRAGRARSAPAKGEGSRRSCFVRWRNLRGRDGKGSGEARGGHQPLGSLGGRRSRPAPSTGMRPMLEEQRRGERA